MGSKSDSCSLLTPSFSLNALCAQVESQETPYSRRSLLGQLAEQRLVELQLIGADGAEGERIEDEHARLALQVLLGEALAVGARER